VFKLYLCFVKRCYRDACFSQAHSWRTTALYDSATGGYDASASAENADGLEPVVKWIQQDITELSREVSDAQKLLQQYSDQRKLLAMQEEQLKRSLTRTEDELRSKRSEYIMPFFSPDGIPLVTYISCMLA
jgi:septal ring factor EnvC (AmiA/AmiB activator)